MHNLVASSAIVGLWTSGRLFHTSISLIGHVVVRAVSEASRAEALAAVETAKWSGYADCGENSCCFMESQSVFCDSTVTIGKRSGISIPRQFMIPAHYRSLSLSTVILGVVTQD